MNSLRWRCLRFDELSLHGLYGLLALRSKVFVVEQACAYQDIDGADPDCLHLLGERDGMLLASARLVPAGLKFPEASIGRVVTEPVTRGSGLGHALMREAIARLQAHWGAQPIRIGAQAHLQAFYRQHGFLPDGEPYDEDGIEHVEMRRA